jgi:hypothetical protein
MSLIDCIRSAQRQGAMDDETADRLVRRFGELTARGVSADDARLRMIAEEEANAVSHGVAAFEELLHHGRSVADAKAEAVKGSGLAEELADRLRTDLDSRRVLEEAPQARTAGRTLSPDQERQFAEAFSTFQTKEERLRELRAITGDRSIGQGTLKKVQRDLAERGLIELRGAGKAVEPAARVEPEFAIPRLAKKQTRAAVKPHSGVFAASAELAWSGLPTAEFRANLRHIAEKRARKDDPAVYGDLTTPEKVEAHINDVLASPSFAAVRMLDGKPHELVIVRLGTDGLDHVVGVALHKGDGTGRMYIATAFNQKRADTVNRLAAAIDQGGADALKRQQTPAGLNEIRSLIEAAPTDKRGPAWEQINTSLAREQAALRERPKVIDPSSDYGARQEAAEALMTGERAVHAPADLVRAVVGAISDVEDVLPAGVRAGALEKLEALRTGGGYDPRVRATYRMPNGDRIAIDGRMSEFTTSTAFLDTDTSTICLNIFGRRGLPSGQHAVGDLVEGLAGRELGERAAPGAGIPFDLAVRSVVLHEVLHALWRGLDDVSRRSLVAHANSLRTLDMTYHEFWAKTHWDSRVDDARGSVTIREAYTELGATPEVLDQEAVAHMVQLAAAGALTAEDVAPVRDILNALLDGQQGHMTVALDVEAGGSTASRLRRLADRIRALQDPRAHSSDMALREEAGKAIRGRATFQVSGGVHTAVYRALADVVDVAPAGVRVGAVEKLEALGSPRDAGVEPVSATPAAGEPVPPPLTPEDIDHLVDAWTYVAISRRLASGGELRPEVSRVEAELARYGVAHAKSVEELRDILHAKSVEDARKLRQARYAEEQRTNPVVRATYRTADGEQFVLEGELSKFTDTGAFSLPEDNVIALNIFGIGSLAGENLGGDLVKGGGRDLGRRPARMGVPFDRAIRGIFLHETLHSLWESLPRDVRDALVRHANDLDVLGTHYHDYSQVSMWEPREPTYDARDRITLRDIITHRGATEQVLDEEAAAYFVQLAMIGAFRAHDVEPVRDVLERLFGPKRVAQGLGARPAGRRAALEGAAGIIPRMTPRDRLNEEREVLGLRYGPWAMAHLHFDAMTRAPGWRGGEVRARIKEYTGLDLTSRDIRDMAKERLGLRDLTQRGPLPDRRLNALEGPRPEGELPYGLRRQMAGLSRQRGEGARLLGRDLRSPGVEALAQSNQAQFMREMIEACRR